VNGYSDRLETLKEGNEFWFGGMLLSLKKMTTKRGDKMAVADMEDLHGKLQIVFYPKVFEASFNLLQVNDIIFVKGKIEHRLDEIKIMAVDVAMPDTIAGKLTKSVLITVNGNCSQELMSSLKSVFIRFKGTSKMFLRIIEDGDRRVSVYLPQYPVVISSEFLAELKKIVPDNAIEVT